MFARRERVERGLLGLDLDLNLHEDFAWLSETRLCARILVDIRNQRE